jgi:hypothetical protein
MSFVTLFNHSCFLNHLLRTWKVSSKEQLAWLEASATHRLGIYYMYVMTYEWLGGSAKRRLGLLLSALSV